MIDFKEEIAKKIANITNLDIDSLKEYIDIPKDENMGDYTFPCFRLAKELKKAPNMIAEEIKAKMQESKEADFIDSIEAVSRLFKFLYK